MTIRTFTSTGMVPVELERETMSRTPKVLARLSVQVLAAMTMLGGQAVLHADSRKCRRPHHHEQLPTATDGYASATPTSAADAFVTHQVKISGTPKATPQTITSGWPATIVALTGAQPSNSTGNANVLSIATNGKSASCSTTSDTSATCGCNFRVTDTVSEAVTLSAADLPDSSVTPASVTDHFSAIFYTNCTQTAPNTTSSCITQEQPGNDEDADGDLPPGWHADQRTSASARPRSDATLQQGSGTPGNNGNVTINAGSQFTPCVTNGSGQCSVVVNTNANASTSATITAFDRERASTCGFLQSNVTPYPDSAARSSCSS